MALIEEAVFGGFISKVFNDVTDVSKKKIKEATEKRNNKYQSLESQIYNIVVDVLNKITYDEYEDDQDKIYDVAEKILIGFKSSKNDNKGNIKLGLSDICKSVDDNKCIDFMKLIYRELSKENYSELYREIRLFQEEKESNKSSRIEQKVDEIQYGVKETNERLNKIETNNYNFAIDQSQVVKKKSRTQEYADKWNANMFLNDFDKRDEKAGVNVKLSEVYLNKHLPHYIWGNNEEKRNDLKELMIEYIEENDRNKMLLILGQPGIGKSTLITWITAHFTEKVDDILVYRFASDLKNIEWKSENITERILNELRLSNEELNEKILILDGYDEISVKDDRKEILDQLYWGVMKNNITKCFLLIVTCRVNYIKAVERVQCKYITLQPWDKEQIESFCKIFCRITNISLDTEAIENIIKNKEILGVPLILYMVLALNISIDKEGSIVDVYDKIFSLEGGIYDRCIDNKSFADRHRVGKMKKQIHQISREIAIWIFENNPVEAYIPAEEYKKICINILQQNEVEQDFIIGIFFEIKHCEGEKSEELYFAHRSIYEYFVVETIYNAIENSMIELSDVSQEELARNIVVYLKKGDITRTIGQYLQYKIGGIYNRLSPEKKERFYDWWELAVAKTMDNMDYHTECQYFMNILKILRLLLYWSKRKYIMENIDRKKLERYIKYSSLENYFKISYLEETGTLEKLEAMEEMGEKTIEEIEDVIMTFTIDLSQMFLYKLELNDTNLRGAILNNTSLEEADLFEAKLSNTELEGADLTGANLEEADLRFANLQSADLTGANLRKANLRYADLRYADLRYADLQDVDLTGTELKGAILSGTCVKHLENIYDEVGKAKVYDESSEEIISYEEYIKRRFLAGEFGNINV